MDELDLMSVPQTTWLDNQGRVVAAKLGDGSLIGPAPSEVGKTVVDEEIEYEVVWDGAKEREGTTTKGELLPDQPTTITMYDILKRNAGYID